jgi:hypothetical protein
MTAGNPEKQHNFNMPPRSDRYDYSYFSPDQNPDGVLLAKQIQAQSYMNMNFVHPEGVITLPNGAKILDETIDNPAGPLPHVSSNTNAEYVLAVEKGSTDMDPLTGKLMTWKKCYSKLEDMSAYHFSRDVIWGEWNEYLQRISEGNGKLVEIEAMGKTKNAGPHAISELMRNELHRSMGKGEIWFFTIVDRTHEAFTHSWGPTAVRQIGTARQIDHPHVYKNVRLIPGIIDVDNFFTNSYHDILKKDNPFALKQMHNYLYMTEGLSDEQLGDERAAFRYQIGRLFINEGNGK